MVEAQVVIGANFGDEGKGLMTDYLASQTPDAVVVRYNGGAQAGHTVVDPDGRRHVFHHFGSGSMVGAPTYLSRYFICNPMLFGEELIILEKLGVKPTMAASPDAMVTTPYDMLINMFVENHRGAGRHGSCGVGINETVTRHQKGLSIEMSDLAGWRLRSFCNTLRDRYVPQRLGEMGITSLTDEQRELVYSDRLLDVFLGQAAEMLDLVGPADMADYEGRPIIFEGAQGLLLDEEHQWFPHVTRSRTGLPNVLALAQEAKIDGLAVTYMTRAYLTRHGAGPLPTEVPMPYPGIVDETNVPHDFQGRLRFGHLDLALLRRTVAADLEQADMPVRARMAVTCLDQVDPIVRFRDGIMDEMERDAFAARVIGILDEPGLVSTGPTRKDVSALI